MADISRISGFLELGERLATAGQPTREQFREISEAGYEVVINLAMPASASWLPDEEALVRGLGLRYYHVPVVWEKPTLDNLRQFFQLMDRHDPQKVFVHCAKNMRVSAFVYLYRVLQKGEPREQSIQDVYRIWKPIPHWQQFMDEALQGPVP